MSDEEERDLELARLRQQAIDGTLVERLRANRWPAVSRPDGAHPKGRGS